MCGIVGLIQTHNPVKAEEIIRMRDCMSHRGPDSAGLYIHPKAHIALAHRRLSIIDLSDDASQPMHNEDKTRWIVYNGEIYNFAELKKELQAQGHHFKSNSDTEVILHAFEEWGAECLHRLNGMFAFAVYDQNNDTLFIARDRMGIKPLYYYYDAKYFIFASELKAILQHPDICKDLDDSSIYDYLTYHYIPSPKSVYLLIRKLPPASYLTYKPHEMQVYTYWDFNYQLQSICTEEAVQRVYRHIEDSVRSHLISDVPAGVFLSGGIDSSAVSLFASREVKSIDSFCVDFDSEEKSEAIYAQTVADHLGTRHHTLLLTEELFNRDLFQQYIDLYDEPFADASGIPLYLIAKYAREYVKLALSGDGGDEVFAGYGKTYERWFRTATRSRWSEAIARLLFPFTQHIPASLRGQPWLQFICGEPMYRTAHIFGATLGPRKQVILSSSLRRFFKDYDDIWFFRQYWRTEFEPLHRLLYLDLKTSLPERMLVKADRATMAASLELRVPLLDHRLVQNVFHFTADTIYPEHRQKYLLREALKEHLPESIRTRPKKGFSIPLNDWLDKNRNEIEKLFLNSYGVEMGLLNPAMRDISSFSRKYRLKGHALWALIVLESFFKKHEAMK